MCSLFFIIILLSRYFYHYIIQVALIFSKIAGFYQNFTNDFRINLKCIVFNFIISIARILIGETRYFYKFLTYCSQFNFFKVDLVGSNIMLQSSWYWLNADSILKNFYFMLIQKNNVYTWEYKYRASRYISFLKSYQKYWSAAVIGRVLSKFIRWSEYYPDMFNWSKLPTFWRIMLFLIKRSDPKLYTKNFSIFSAIFYKSVINLFMWHNNYSIRNYLYSFKSQRLLSFNSINKGSWYYFFNVFLSINFQSFLLFYRFFKNTLVPVFVGLLFLYYSFFFFKLGAAKTVANWLGLGLFVFWLLSTFNFFIKRGRYSKYTSAVQRFWKRAFMCFWVIEGFLFLIFFYYLLNASGEPFFMFDTYGLYIYNLIQIKNFLLAAFLVVVVIHILIFLLISIKFTTIRKNIYLLLIITIILLYILFTESYQFYYLLNFYVDYIWNLSEDDNIWELDYDIPRTRNKNHYITLIVIAKFWHYIFIFASWVFFIIKTLELNRIRYAFLSMNLQNIIIFYLMNWLCLYSWLKWVVRRYLDQTYYWFFTSFRPVALNIILSDFISYIRGIVFTNIGIFKYTYNYSFYYMFASIDSIYTQSTFFKLSVLTALTK